MQLLFRHIAAASWLSSVSRVFCADISLLSCYICYLYAMLCSCRTISTKFNHPHLKGSANITSLRGRHASATKIRGHNLELKKSLPLVVDCLVIVEAVLSWGSFCSRGIRELSAIYAGSAAYPSNYYAPLTQNIVQILGTAAKSHDRPLSRLFSKFLTCMHCKKTKQSVCQLCSVKKLNSQSHRGRSDITFAQRGEGVKNPKNMHLLSKCWAQCESCVERETHDSL